MLTKKSWIKRIAAFMLLSLIAVPMLAACSTSGDADNETTRVLRIATTYGDDRNSHIRSEFTDLFEYANRNIEIEIVSAYNYNDYYYYGRTGDEEEPDPIEELKKMMEGPNPPDIVMLGFEEMPAFIEENMLQPLDPKIQESNFSVDGFAEAVIGGIRDLGNGTLYGLAPTFSSYALIYNIDLFANAGIPMPYDGMTWDEVFDLASRFAGQGTESEPIFGFAFTDQMYSDFFYDMNIYTAPLGLKMFDDEAERMLVNSPQWEQVWSTMMRLYEEGIIPSEEDWQKMRENRDPSRPYSPFDYNTFLSGRVAMTLMHHSNLDQIINANRNKDSIEGFDGINWDVVTLPFHPEHPNVGGNVSMHPIFAINANAQNPDDAWEFIKFVNGEEWAKLKSRSSYSLVSRVQYNEPRGGVDYNIEAFFKTKPAVESMMSTDIYRRFPNIWEVQSIGQRKFYEVMQGNLTVKEALEQWENEGNQALQRMRENPDGGGGGVQVLPMPAG